MDAMICRQRQVAGGWVLGSAGTNDFQSEIRLAPIKIEPEIFRHESRLLKPRARPKTRARTKLAPKKLKCFLIDARANLLARIRKIDGYDALTRERKMLTNS